MKSSAAFQLELEDKLDSIHVLRKVWGNRDRYAESVNTFTPLCEIFYTAHTMIRDAIYDDADNR